MRRSVWGDRGGGLLKALAWIAFVLVAGVPDSVQAQVTWRDLVFTGGASAEHYEGNLASVTATAVDSTGDASAAVGELAVRGGLTLWSKPDRTLLLDFDGGLRQFTATGFEVRDYAPRELVGVASVRYRHVLASLGELWLESEATGRSVEDRPPMPLFIQPGYRTLSGRVRLNLYPRRGIFFDAQLFGDRNDYGATALTPQLDLLDRNAFGGEVGATVGGEEKTLRLNASFQATEYGNQGTFDPGDPFRRDRTGSLGATGTLRLPIFAQVGVEGTLNRSNSARPEYNALSVRALLSAPLPGDLTATLFAVLTMKDYLTETQFARLIPGEEADNASVVYLELSRPLMVNLDGAIRFAWTRAETDIGDSYFQRYGATFLLRYRPFDR